VDRGQVGTVDVHAVSGATIELVTPAAVAGVRGTVFSVGVSDYEDTDYEFFDVTESAVDVKAMVDCETLLVTSGNHRVEAHVRKIRKLLRQRSSNRGKKIAKEVEKIKTRSEGWERVGTQARNTVTEGHLLILIGPSGEFRPGAEYFDANSLKFGQPHHMRRMINPDGGHYPFDPPGDDDD